MDSPQGGGGGAAAAEEGPVNRDLFTNRALHEHEIFARNWF